MTIPFAAKGTFIPPTQHCINTEVKSYVAAAAITGTIYDTLVFLAISYTLINTNESTGTFKGKTRMFFGGHGMTSISRALFQGGQLYYL